MQAHLDLIIDPPIYIIITTHELYRLCCSRALLKQENQPGLSGESGGNQPGLSPGLSRESGEISVRGRGGGYIEPLGREVLRETRGGEFPRTPRRNIPEKP